MNRAQVWFVHLANLLVAGTGIAWVWMLFFVEPADDFALLNHPLQDETQAAHVLTAPLYLVAMGVVWALHAGPYLADGERERRRTGIALLALLAPLVASGYLLQVSVDETWRSVWSWMHLVTGAAWIVGYLVHQLLPEDAGLLPEERGETDA